VKLDRAQKEKKRPEVQHETVVIARQKDATRTKHL